MAESLRQVREKVRARARACARQEIAQSVDSRALNRRRAGAGW
jgi:hypothetical protein